MYFGYGADGELVAESGAVTVEPCTRCFLTADHLGSTRLVTDGVTGVAKARFDYAPFGEEVTADFRSGNVLYPRSLYPQAVGKGPDQKFTGKERDAETGLDYFGARYYGGAQGRFTSPDYTADGSDPVPIPGADLDNPQSLNLYSYVRNNPTVNIDEDGHDCVVQTRNSETKETVFVTSGNCDKISVGDGQSKTYIGGTVDVGSVQSNGSGGISLSYTPYSGGAGVADLQSAPVPDRPGLAYGWGNNAQGYQQIAAAGKFIERTTLVYAAVFGSVGAAVAGGEIAAATAASRSGIIFRLAHGMRVAAGHSQVLAQQAAIKNAIAAAIASGAVQKIAGGGFQGIVNVAGTYIRFTGAFTPNGVVVSNVMGAALQR